MSFFLKEIFLLFIVSIEKDYAFFKRGRQLVRELPVYAFCNLLGEMS